MGSDYRVLVGDASGGDARPLLHLIRDDAEASLCGIPRPSLGRVALSDEVVCPDCIAWLPRRLAFSDRFRKVDRARPAPGQVPGGTTNKV